MWTAIFGAIGSLAAVIDNIMGWFRERSIHDTGVQDERRRVADAEREAKDAMDKAVPADDPIERLRRGEF